MYAVEPCGTYLLPDLAWVCPIASKVPKHLVVDHTI